MPFSYAPMNIIIRQGKPEDFPAIFLLIQEFAVFQKTPEKLLTSLEQMLADQHLFQCFVAQTDVNKIIGFASYFFAYYSWSGKALYIDDLYVQEAYRANNTGTGLLEAVIDLAKKENCKKLRWQVSGWNDEAIAFYQKMGANIDRTEINCDLEIS